MNTWLFVQVFEIHLIEIILFQLGAILLGFVIHFLISSKKRFTIGRLSEHAISEEDHARLRIYEDLDRLKEENEQLHRQLDETDRFQQKLEDELEQWRNASTEKAEAGLDQGEITEGKESTADVGQDRNREIHQLLLEKIEWLKSAEQKQLDAIRENETLHSQLRELRTELSEKETQIRQIRQQYSLSGELLDRIDKAYSEFNLLQDKIQQVETYVVQPQHRTFDFEELQESFLKMSRDFEDLKLKFLDVMEENQRVTRLLAEAEEKLQEATFQRQQLQKKVSYLDTLNNDLQKVAEHNKKLENQLRRIGEINTLLSRQPGASPSMEEGDEQ